MPEYSEDYTPESIKSETNQSGSKLCKFFKIIGALLALGVFVSLLLVYIFIDLNTAPQDFPAGQPITIETGSSVKDITTTLENNSVIKSADLLYYTLVLFHDPENLKASTYIFETPLSTLEIAERLSEGDFDTDLIKFTHIEGESVAKLAERASQVLVNFNTEIFLANASDIEGRLYPDTYFIPADYTETELLELMIETFESKVSSLQNQIESSNLTEDEVIVLASIIEREANSPESMRLVSGILQNRLEIGMALQADASIEYVLDKPLSELTPADLEIDSPYNTYLYPGLPPTPIGNPGLEAIMAVLEPTESDYFYYITGNDGEFYYAETYNQHLVNIEKYLK